VSRAARHGASVRGLRADALLASWHARPAERVARDLLGMLLVSEIGGLETAGRIVETEAYVGSHDDASHAAARIGRTARNTSMFGPPGTAYVYRIYGVHWCLNIVTDDIDVPAAVLIRALEPVHGLEVMRARRHAGQKRLPDTALASGPGRLAAALGVDGRHDGHPLDRAPLWVKPASPVSEARVVVGPRIGITRAIDWPLRFHEAANPWVSRR
jgi:DNA-3-methyladenine glycosylase